MAEIGFIVPVYKVKENYFRECISSIVNQTFTDIEIILIDDCSPDSSGEICDEFAKNDSRITVIHHEVNKGVSEARNSGLSVSKAKWITFVDSDDWIELNMCELMLEKLNQTDVEPDMIIMSGWMSYADFEIPNIIDTVQEFNTYLDREKLQISELTSFYRGGTKRVIAADSAWAKFYSTDCLRDNSIKFRPIPYREDGLFFQEVVEVSNKILWLTELVYHYRMTSGSAVNSYRSNSPSEMQRYTDLLWEFARTKNKSKEYFNALYASSFWAVQIVITLCYFNKNNPNSYHQRFRECRSFLNREPYSKMFDHIDLGKLTRNHLLKALCIKFGWYAGVSILRNLYFFKQRYTLYD